MRLNRIELIGFLGKDAETKHFEGGNKKVRLSLATDDGYYNSNKEWQKNVNWHNIVAWGKAADNSENYRRGDKVYVVGKLTYRSYQKDDETKYITEINLLASAKIQNDKPEEYSFANKTQPIDKPIEQAERPTFPPDFEDDLPF